MSAARLLARVLIYNGEAHPLTLITPQPDNTFILEQFRYETADTIFENDPLALIPVNSTLPEGNTIDEIIRSLRHADYFIQDQKLKLIHLSNSGCSDYLFHQ